MPRTVSRNPTVRWCAHFSRKTRRRSHSSAIKQLDAHAHEMRGAFVVVVNVVLLFTCVRERVCVYEFMFFVCAIEIYNQQTWMSV